MVMNTVSESVTDDSSACVYDLTEGSSSSIFPRMLKVALPMDNFCADTSSLTLFNST